ncbi:MAG TPA: circularly permuted type 2 ATP-grasp protein, partial [Methylophilus sp.]
MQPVLNQLYFSDRYNELLDSQGQPRPHWQALVAQLESEEPAVMRKRMEAVQRQIRDNGVTYNVYADTHGVQRPWDLDVLPLIIPSEEWQEIAAAVAQRATLLNQVLLDIYGEQRLFASGQLPPALIYGHNGFLPSCVGIPHYDNIALHNYAVDLARSPNGQWWVVSDRTQSPTGAGYALENRTIISSVFPEMFRDLNIERLSGFFASMRDSLAHWGHRVAQNQAQTVPGITPLSQGEPPLVVILTPGPYNETYHEQSFLAGYLGYPLVQGSDLTVRNGVVWLKTIAGLKPVHAILRRIDDDYCDPLELNAESLLGVA